MKNLCTFCFLLLTIGSVEAATVTSSNIPVAIPTFSTDYVMGLINGRTNRNFPLTNFVSRADTNQLNLSGALTLTNAANVLGGSGAAITGITQVTDATNALNTQLRAALAQTNATQLTLTHAGTVTLDLSYVNAQADFTGCTGAVTFATSGLVAAHNYTLFGWNTNAANITPTFPAWQFQGGAPTTITAGKRFVLSLSARGAFDTNVWAAFSEAQ